MINPERGKLIPVTGNNDSPDLANAVDVQFNPASLKVSLSNTLKENPRNGNSRAAQYVDKSSSSLSIELLFDTTYIDADVEQVYTQRAQSEGRTRENIEVGSDVRLLTKRIADRFIKPVRSGNRLRAPKRCLFQWGAFEFLGLVESFEETLDFFSPEGRPLRASVALSLKEDRYQFRNREVDQAARETPTLTSTGNANSNDDNANPDGNGAARPNQNSTPVPGGSDNKPGNWRDTALFNGVENPRLPSASVLAVPTLSAGASIGLGGGAGIKTSISAGAGVSLDAAASVGAKSTGPAFSFGASGSLGTGIPGAFNVSGDSRGGLSAGSLISGASQLRNETKVGVSTQAGVPLGVKTKTGVGFD